MFKGFMKKLSVPLLLNLTVVIIFATIFALFMLDWQLFFLGVQIDLLVIVVYVVFQLIRYQQEVVLTVRLEQTQEALRLLRNEMLERERNNEEYFMLWVHQMKTPITASHLLLENPTEENTIALKQEMTKIENYTNMALNYLKVTNPDRDMNFTYVTIDELVAPLLKRYRLQFIHNHILLHYETIYEQVLTEPNLTSLMVEQILSNALKYAKHAEIWIGYDRRTQVLTIADSGVGIRQEDQIKIFDKGYAGLNGQLNAKSSGIGLFLVRLISERLDQPVGVRSKLGEGSQFTIQLYNE